MNTDETAQPLEIVTNDTAMAMERGQIDAQVATAKKYPRSLSQVKQRILAFATLDEETAAACFYTLPARKGGDGKAIQGPSVRLAEIAMSCYQHIAAGARVVADDGKVITAQGAVHDLENNVRVVIESKRRVTNKDGKRYSDDMVVTTGNAAASIALRNAVLRVVPMALIKPAYEAAKKLAVGDAKSLVDRRAKSLEHFAKMGIAKERVFAALEVKGIDDIQLEHLEKLIGFANAIKEGDTSIEEVFPATQPSFKKQEQPTGNEGLPIQTQLAEHIVKSGISFDTFYGWAVGASKISEQVGGFSEIPTETAEALFRVKDKVVAEIKKGMNV